MNLHRLVKDNTGLDLPDAPLERALRERMGACGAHAREDYAPLPGTPEFEALLELVVVPESWMFRDPAVFDAALRFVQRRLLARPGARVRILCLPCAGGEEAYSMAMRLHDAGIAPARCRIDAVDLSQAAIAQARQGRYTRNAFRGADLAFRARWFTQEDDSWLIRPELRDYIGLRQGNLFAMDADAHRGYDLVFCRNLLIYFDADGQRRGARAVDALLASDGMLLSGYAEAPAFCSHGFAPAPGYGVFALQRQARAPGRAARMRAM
ncbi:MAG TPA: CheR family methyltransferase, partial [Telluria sp.]